MVSKENSPGRRKAMAGYATGDMRADRGDYRAPTISPDQVRSQPRPAKGEREESRGSRAPERKP